MRNMDDRCGDWRARLSPYLEDELTPAEKPALETHLAGCAACRRELEDLRRTVGLLHDLPQITPPREILDRVREEIRRPSLAARWAGIFQVPWVRPLAQAAAVVLVVASIIVLQQRYPGMRQEAGRPESPRLVPLEPAPSGPAPSVQAGPPAAETAAGGTGETLTAAREPAAERRREAARVAPPKEKAAAPATAAPATVAPAAPPPPADTEPAAPREAPPAARMEAAPPRPAPEAAPPAVAAGETAMPPAREHATGVPAAPLAAPEILPAKILASPPAAGEAPATSHALEAKRAELPPASAAKGVERDGARIPTAEFLGPHGDRVPASAGRGRLAEGFAARSGGEPAAPAGRGFAAGSSAGAPDFPSEEPWESSTADLVVFLRAAPGRDGGALVERILESFGGRVDTSVPTTKEGHRGWSAVLGEAESARPAAESTLTVFVPKEKLEAFTEALGKSERLTISLAQMPEGPRPEGGPMALVVLYVRQAAK